MKNVRLYLTSIALLPAFAFLQGQTVEEIIAKSILAAGGKDSIAKINSITMESTTQVMGNELATTTVILNGKGYKNSSDMNGQAIVQCYTEKGGWSINPMGGGSPEALPPGQLKYTRLQFEIGGPLLNYEAKGNKFELIGKENVGPVEAYKLKLTTRDSAEINYFIDPVTFHVIQTTQKSEMMGQEVLLKISQSDFRKTEFGYVMPFAMDLSFGEQFSLTVIVKKVEFNKPVDPAIFDMPK